jgi:transcriptional regulator
MFTSPAFIEGQPEVLHGLIRENPLGTLVSSQDGNIECSHIPMVLDTGNNVLRAHLARANQHWTRLAGSKVLVVFHGPEQYITPSWYPSKRAHGKVVPTWNYVVVHVRGQVRVVDDTEFLLRNVTELTTQNEGTLSEPWSVTDAPVDFIRGLTRSIVGIEIAITAMEGKWKISQNRSAEDIAGVKQGLQALGTNKSMAMLKAMERTGAA